MDSEPPFDPYHIWLGISPTDQPANHYRLLGIDLFESSPAVIENAADRQMAHVRAASVGRHAEESQRVLNEISEARVTLLDPDRKSQYDQTLKSPTPPRMPLSRLRPMKAEVASTSLSMDAANKAAAHSRSFPSPALKSPPPMPSGATKSNRRPAFSKLLTKVAVIVGGSVAGIVFAVALFWALQSAPARGVNEQSVATNEKADTPVTPDTRKVSSADLAPMPESSSDKLRRTVVSSIYRLEAENASGMTLSSGFLVDARGWIAADYKSVRSAHRITIRFLLDANGSELQQRSIARFVALNKKRDLAILQLDGVPHSSSRPLRLTPISSEETSKEQTYFMAGFDSSGKQVFEPCNLDHISKSKSFVLHDGDLTKSLEGGPLFGPGGGVVGVHWNEANRKLSARTIGSLVELIDSVDQIQQEIRTLQKTVKESADSSQRKTALDALAKFGSVASAALPEAVSALDDSSSEVRLQAAKTIGEIGAFGDQSASAITPVAGLVEKEGSSKLGQACLATLVKIGPTRSELERILRKMLVGGTGSMPKPNSDSKLHQDREFACDHLVQLGQYGRWSLPILRELLVMAAMNLDESNHLLLFEHAAAAVGAIGIDGHGLSELLQKHKEGGGLRSSSPDHLESAKVAAGKALRMLDAAGQ